MYVGVSSTHASRHMSLRDLCGCVYVCILYIYVQMRVCVCACVCVYACMRVCVCARCACFRRMLHSYCMQHELWPQVVQNISPCFYLCFLQPSSSGTSVSKLFVIGMLNNGNAKFQVSASQTDWLDFSMRAVRKNFCHPLLQLTSCK